MLLLSSSAWTIAIPQCIASYRQDKSIQEAVAKWIRDDPLSAEGVGFSTALVNRAIMGRENKAGAGFIGLPGYPRGSEKGREPIPVLVDEGRRWPGVREFLGKQPNRPKTCHECGSSLKADARIARFGGSEEEVIQSSGEVTWHLRRLPRWAEAKPGDCIASPQNEKHPCASTLESIYGLPNTSTVH